MRGLARYAFLIALAIGCSKKDSSGASDMPPPHDPVASGAQIYASMCKSCHGARGEGGQGPSLRDEKKSQAELSTFIDAQMPLGDPGKCRGQCADDVAAYILATFKGPIVCSGTPTPAARGLRLLTRREYRNSVADLFGAAPPAACTPTTFNFDPKGRTLKTVHIAGSFNGWPQTIAAGGWPLTLSGTTWTVTRQLPQGQNTYKLVLDESEWIADPSNPNTVPDGFGGQNSVVNVACSSSSAPDVTLGFPPETRPEGFPFDDDGNGRVVTSVLASEYLRAGLAVAAAVDTTKIVTCDFSVGTCAEDSVRALGKRVFRRPLAPAEVTRYRDLAVGQGDAAKGTRAAIAAMLASPGFLYRSELGEKQPDGTYRLNPWEVATALSYIFWATTPDDALLAAADKGELTTTDQIEAQARRLLASPRARDVIGVFAEQWLGAENVTTVDKNDGLYPGFDATLRAALLEETHRFVLDVIFDGSHKVDDLFVANYTFLNQRLAQHYGIGGVKDDAMQKITYPDGRRAGILGHASVLAATGLSDQSSPIRRGLFVRRRLLCQEFPPPPPNAGGVPKVDPNATTRDRFFQHTQNPFCHSCHQYIDPVGFGFEHFDTVGKWRDTEAGKPIDASGDMNDVEGLGSGTHAPFGSLPDLGRTLAASDAAKTCLVRQYYRFARGRLDDDICDSAPMKARFYQNGGDVRELLIGAVTSPDFMVRK